MMKTLKKLGYLNPKIEINNNKVLLTCCYHESLCNILIENGYNCHNSNKGIIIEDTPQKLEEIIRGI